MSNWRHLPKGQECRLCGAVSGQKDNQGKRSSGCSCSTINPQLYYCHRQKQRFYVDLQGRVGTEAKWEEVGCLLCGGVCARLVENRKQGWCRTKGVTFFVRADGTFGCRALGIV